MRCDNRFKRRFSSVLADLAQGKDSQELRDTSGPIAAHNYCIRLCSLQPYGAAVGTHFVPLILPPLFLLNRTVVIIDPPNSSLSVQAKVRDLAWPSEIEGCFGDFFFTPAALDTRIRNVGWQLWESSFSLSKEATLPRANHSYTSSILWKLSVCVPVFPILWLDSQSCPPRSH